MTRDKQTRRERKALELKAQGLSTVEIARRLRLTPRRIQQFAAGWRDGKLPVVTLRRSA